MTMTPSLLKDLQKKEMFFKELLLLEIMNLRMCLMKRKFQQ